MLQYIKKINPLLFIVCFSVGLYMSYYFGEKIRHIVRYPTPEDSDNVVYKKKDNSCYLYKLKQIQCPSNCDKLVSEKIV